MSKVYKDVKSFEIDRSKWYRGRGSMGSYLLNGYGQMCCLGFYALACGLPEEEIRIVEEPSSVIEDQSDWESFLINEYEFGGVINSMDCNRLMEVNDDEHMDDKERESIITEVFKAHDIDVTFKD